MALCGPSKYEEGLPELVDVMDITPCKHRDTVTRNQIVDHGQHGSSSFQFKALIVMHRSNWTLAMSKRFGEVICRRHMNCDTLHALQLGSRHFAGGYMAQSKKELSPYDFRHTKSNWIRYSEPYPRRLLPGTITDFEWKDYCPAVFRHIQELDNIDYADYMLSVCGDETLREATSPGKSGSLFYLSKNDRFVIKTLRKSEVKVLLEMLPNYYAHVMKCKTSLLAKFYGLHVVRPLGGIKVYFVVMENIFRSDLSIHRRYDLKGSSQGRKVSKGEVQESTTFKDLDLDFCFYLNPLLRHRLLAQIKKDCDFLVAEGIMDYSLLLGMHIEAPYRGDYAHKRLTLSDICQHPDRPGFKLGVRMPACAVKTAVNETGSVSLHRRVGGKGNERYNVLLYFGIIDMLQGYNVLKRFEHAYKSIQYDGTSISAVNPKAYSTRLQDFLCEVFKADD